MFESKSIWVLVGVILSTTFFVAGFWLGGQVVKGKLLKVENAQLVHLSNVEKQLDSTKTVLDSTLKAFISEPTVVDTLRIPIIASHTDTITHDSLVFINIDRSKICKPLIDASNALETACQMTRDSLIGVNQLLISRYDALASEKDKKWGFMLGGGPGITVQGQTTLFLGFTFGRILR